MGSHFLLILFPHHPSYFSLKKELEGLRQEYSRMAGDARKKQVALDALDTRVLAYFQVDHILRGMG